MSLRTTVPSKQMVQCILLSQDAIAGEVNDFAAEFFKDTHMS